MSPSRPTGVGPEGVFELFPFVTQLRERDVIACPPPVGCSGKVMEELAAWPGVALGGRAS